MRLSWGLQMAVLLRPQIYSRVADREVVNNSAIHAVQRPFNTVVVSLKGQLGCRRLATFNCEISQLKVFKIKNYRN